MIDNDSNFFNSLFSELELEVIQEFLFSDFVIKIDDLQSVVSLLLDLVFCPGSFDRENSSLHLLLVQSQGPGQLVCRFELHISVSFQFPCFLVSGHTHALYRRLEHCSQLTLSRSERKVRNEHCLASVRVVVFFLLRNVHFYLLALNVLVIGF